MRGKCHAEPSKGFPGPYAPALSVWLVTVPMVDVRVVCMGMTQRFVTMPMGMRLSNRVVRPMRMTVMIVVHMTMLVFHRIMLMLMGMGLDQMKVEADRHEQARPYQP